MGLSPARPCSKAELGLFLPKGRFIGGTYTRSLVTSPEKYMAWATRRFQGGKFEGTLESWNDLIGR